MGRVARLTIWLAFVCIAGCQAVPRPVSGLAPSVSPSPSAIQQAGHTSTPSVDILPATVIGIPPRLTPQAGGGAELSELQRLAIEFSPAVKQAAADVAAARGAAIQAGLHPNPTVGYQGDQIGSGHTAGQQGVFVNQTIVTQGKLGLAQAAAMAEVSRAELTLRQTESDVRAQVRGRYFAIRTAAESIRIAESMAQTAEALSERQRKLLESGQPVAPHEVDQARALAAAARAEVIQAQNRRTAAERQLSAITGNLQPPVPHVTPMSESLPAFTFDNLKALLDGHTEVHAAAAQLERVRYQLELARITPYPNVETNTYLQHDYQTRTAQVGFQVGVAIPVFDRNEGNIVQSEANLVRASHEAARVRQELVQKLTDAYERYATNRRLLTQYRDEILPAQVKAFDGIRKRFEQEPGRVSFSEVVLSQQSLATTYNAYLNVLFAAWQAVAELERITQSDNPSRDLPTPGPVPVDSWPEPTVPRKP